MKSLRRSSVVRFSSASDCWSRAGPRARRRRGERTRFPLAVRLVGGPQAGGGAAWIEPRSARPSTTRRPGTQLGQDRLHGGSDPDIWPAAGNSAAVARRQTNGMILRHGYIVAEFGDTNRVDPTYSVAKSFLSTVLGLTLDRGMIKSIDDPVRNYIKDGGYDSPHNAAITWRHHAQQDQRMGRHDVGQAARLHRRRAVRRGEMKPREIQEPGHVSTNTTTCASTASRCRCSRYGSGRCPTCSRPRSWTRSARPTRGSGFGYDNADVDDRRQEMNR